ncbi:transmembrane protease serine 11D-like [Bacillus rossius redtenbacheri]|uniref:transmembrane protease serine 11D-like n=1 Tax=Bacillus rossius redtenbacheri TaxID=93214 RepID=UPI002FDDFD5C
MSALLLALLALGRVPTGVQSLLAKTDNLEQKETTIRNARFGDVTFMVWMGEEEETRCGAAVISDTWAVTVASCALRHLAGEANIIAATKNGSHTIHRIAVVVVHHSFSEMEGNIALVQVKDPFSANRNVRTVELPLQDEDLSASTKAVVIARRVAALDEANSSSGGDLKCLSVDLESQEACEGSPVYSGSFAVTADMICAQRSANAAYKEELGSAMVVRSRRRAKLVGLLGWVHHTGPRAVAVYTRLAAYRLWVHLKTGA